MTTVKDLVKSRDVLKGRIVKAQAAVLAWPADVLLTKVNLMVTKLLDFNTKLEGYFNDIAAKTSEADFAADHDAVFDTMFDSLESLRVKVIDIQKVKEVAANTSSPSIKLDRIKLPQFSGKFNEWQSFHDLFKSSVNDNSKLSGAEKMVHLKSSLIGDAASIISSFQPTEAGYRDAWDLVKKRYSNKREIIFAHIRKFDELKVLTHESSTGLRGVSDCVSECVRSLKSLRVPVEHWDLIMIYFSLKKLDPETKKEWLLLQKADLPKLDDFIEFLESRSRALSDSTLSTHKQKSSFQEKKITSVNSAAVDSNFPPASSSIVCQHCSGVGHHIYRCKAFLQLSVPQRKAIVDKKQLCFNCMAKGHIVTACKNMFSCKLCGKRHNTLLHKAPPPPPPPPPQSKASGPSNVVESSYGSLSASTSVVLLGTFVANVNDQWGRKQSCRVFLDSGSESHFVSEQCVDRLGLKREKTCVKVNGIGETPGGSATGIVSLRLSSRIRDYSIDIKALVYKKITGLMPKIECISTFDYLEHLELGDPYFYKPGPTDILLGAKAAGFIMLPGLMHGEAGSPVAQNTQFGWILSGDVKSTVAYQPSVTSHHATCNVHEPCLQSTMEKFWELDENGLTSSSSTLTEEDSICEQHFASTHKRDINGRYMVELPFKEDAPELGLSYQSALKRFLHVERRLARQPEVKEEYIKCMRESVTNDFMEPVPQDELKETGSSSSSSSSSYYMPHREVVKDSSSTTKVRIVYDASAKTSTGVSLNNTLMTGPTLQVNLVDLLIRFRSHIIAMSADIVKFYPQFLVNPKHRDFLRLIWREAPNLPIQIYRMKRLTFGTSPAPFLAIRCLHQLAEDECQSKEKIKTIIKEDFLVDNLLTGANTVNEALAIQSEVLSVMQKGNLHLQKWSSNCNEILESVPPSQRESNLPLPITEDESVKTIGILWNPGSDTFGISIVAPDLSKPPTKRLVLSAIARIFDPLGFLSPVTIRPKILMQEIWKAKLGWDTPLPLLLLKHWTRYVEDLEALKSFKIDRCITKPTVSSSENNHFELHGFCDASKLAYSACVYVRTVDERGLSAVNLVIAKTKVAPIKFVSIPRMELCGCVLLSKLMKTVSNSSKLHFMVSRCWTDSTIVLDWLRSEEKLPVFINNRIRKMSSIFPHDFWFHVKGTDNPADSASRGISSSALLEHSLWYTGPPWLSTTTFPHNMKKAEEEETTAVHVVSKLPSPVSLIINKYSSYTQMKRILAYWMRFINNSRLAKEKRNFGSLTSEELNQALMPIVRSVQSECFNEEVLLCKRQEMVKSSVKFLSPFIDKNGILRVGGRLNNSSLTVNQKNPILLPREHKFTEAVVRYFHVANLHAPPQLLLALIREQFWIVRGPDVTRQCVRRCVICHKHNHNTVTQIMGQLPAPRVNISKVFAQTGLDFAGPFFVCVRPGRNPKIVKSYVCLFVCMCTRAVHLELVGDLTTASFIAALNRFFSRRGYSSDIYCDGGKNFVGAANEIKAFTKFISSSSHVNSTSDFLAEKGVQFHFNPPLSPHHGGLWEAGVKAMKHHLKRVTDNRKLSIEEFSTLLCQIEAAMNSRPLTPLSADPSDLNVLTPGHFLVGGNLSALPDHDITHLNPNRLSRWQLVQQMFQHFWRRWTMEYLKGLQTRPKWYAPQPNLEVGILVLIIDDDISWGPLKWKLGRIVKTYPGTDGLVRVCDVKTSTGSILKRPVVKLSPLPIY